MRSHDAGSRERSAFESAKRACYAGLDSATLREELVRRAAGVLRTEAFSFSVADPEVGLFVHSIAEGVPDAAGYQFMTEIYPIHEAALLLDQARAGTVVSTTVSPLYASVRGQTGLTSDLRAIFSIRGSLWGVWCLMRESSSPPLGEAETRFLRRLAPHVTAGLRQALLHDAAHAPEADEGGEPRTPGVVVYDARWRMVLRDAAASRYLADLADSDSDGGPVPQAVTSATTLLRWRAGRPGASEDDRSSDALLRAQGRSGRWYTLHAALAEPDPAGETRMVIVVTPASRNDTAGILTRLYGLTPRERLVLVRLARGESTKAIAARLGLSAYTVQDYIDRACDKVGVRGRKALLAKLFFDVNAARSV